MYLCYKVGLAKANTLVYEAGELPFCPANPLAFHVPLPWCLLAGTFIFSRTPLGLLVLLWDPWFLPLEPHGPSSFWVLPTLPGVQSC